MLSYHSRAILQFFRTVKPSASNGLFGRLLVSSLWLVAAQVHALDVVKNTADTLRIVTAADTTKPLATIATPAANANIAEGAAANVTGTATDNKGVLKVQFSLNDAAFADATTTVSSSGLSATYTAALSPVPGVNTVAVKSIDTSNNESTVVTRSFNYNVIRPLTVNVTGSGTVPLPIPAASYKVGFHYTLVAKPAAGQVFNGWTVNDATGTGITPAMLALPSLSFTHQQGLVLTAAFIPNPFAVTGVRVNPAVGVSKSFGLFFLYYILDNVASSLATKQLVDPQLAAWLPNLGMAALAIWLFSRLR